MLKYLLLLIFLSQAQAGTFVKYHVNASNGSVAMAKALTVGYQADLGFIKSKLEAGAIFDNRKGAKTSALSIAGLGIQPEIGPVYVNFFQSVGLISHPDAYLGSNFQFCEELGIGIKGNDKTSIGVLWKHVSNAGLKAPNMGKDFIGLQVMIPW